MDVQCVRPDGRLLNGDRIGFLATPAARGKLLEEAGVPSVRDQPPIPSGFDDCLYRDPVGALQITDALQRQVGPDVSVEVVRRQEEGGRELVRLRLELALIVDWEMA